MGLRFFIWSRCDFDKTTGQARIDRVMFFWPCKAIEVPLTEIADVKVATATARVEGSDVEKVYPEVQFKNGKPLALPCFTFSGNAVRKAVNEMRLFLGFGEAQGTKG